MEEPATLLAELTRALSRNRGSGPIAARLCDALSQVVSADGGAVTMGEVPAGRVVLCATDGPAAEIEDAQEVLRQGPTVDALLTASAVTGLSLAEQRRRWPLLIDLLESKEAVVSLHAFPVRPDSVVLGAVTLYQSGERTLAVSHEEAQFLANAVGVALLGKLTAGSLDEKSWSVRDRIDQATGMVVAQLRIPPEDALAVMRAHAFAGGIALSEVSRRIVGRELDFSRPGNDEGMQP